MDIKKKRIKYKCRFDSADINNSRKSSRHQLGFVRCVCFFCCSVVILVIVVIILLLLFFNLPIVVLLLQCVCVMVYVRDHLQPI